MKKPKRPDLKMPALKTPAFVSDLYYDLRDRRLLPLVALIVVAIAAVPFLLGGKSEDAFVAPSGTPLSELGTAGAKASSLTVVEATPGLRDYHQRLADRSPTNPFDQRYTALPESAQVQQGDEGEGSGSTGAPGGSGGGGSATVEVETEKTTPSHSGGGSPGDSSNGGNSGSGGTGKGHLVLFDYAIDVRISHPASFDENGNAEQPDPIVKHRVLPQTPLPGEKAPLVTYMGPGRKEGNKATGKVLLFVSGDVHAISGEYRCVSGAGDACELLEVEPGFPLTFAYGDGDASYTIKVLSIELVVTGHS